MNIGLRVNLSKCVSVTRFKHLNQFTKSSKIYYEHCVNGSHSNFVFSIFLHITIVDGRTRVVEEIVVPSCSHERIYVNRFAINMQLMLMDFLCNLRKQDGGLAKIFFSTRPNYKLCHKFCFKYYA